MSDAFEKCVIRKSGKDFYEIKCVLGLWGVDCPTKESAEREARHYWIQYMLDGEYDKHLGF